MTHFILLFQLESKDLSPRRTRNGLWHPCHDLFYWDGLDFESRNASGTTSVFCTLMCPPCYQNHHNYTPLNQPQFSEGKVTTHSIILYNVKSLDNLWSEYFHHFSSFEAFEVTDSVCLTNPDSPYQDVWWAGDQRRFCPSWGQSSLWAVIACCHPSGEAADWGSHIWASKERIMVRKLIIKIKQYKTSDWNCSTFQKLCTFTLSLRNYSNCWLQRLRFLFHVTLMPVNQELSKSAVTNPAPGELLPCMF